MTATLTYAETRVTPSLTLSERFDTNVFFSPQEFLPDRTLWDFATTVSPGVQIHDRGRQIDTSLNATISGTTFVNNPDLSFVGTDVTLNSKLNGWIGRMIPGARLEVSDALDYTPEPPAFLTGGRPSQNADIFTRGIQGVRANTFTNVASATGGYTLTRRMDLQADYSYAIFRVGSFLGVDDPSALPVTFFRFNVENVSIGPSFRMSKGDTVALNYERTDMKGEGQQIVSQGGNLEYTKAATSWRSSLKGGAMVVGSSAYLTGSISLSVGYGKSTAVNMSASRVVSPGFFGVATGGPQALVSTNASLGIEQKLSKVLTLSASGNYALNETVPVDVLTIRSYMATLLLRYKITRSLDAMVSYDYNFFSLESPVFDVFRVDRNFLTLSITGTWQ
jgi:hypothetical protein